MAKKEEAEDMTFGYYAEDDDFPTQNGTMVNNFEETESKKTLAVSDVADRIANRQNSEEMSQKKVILLGVFSGFAIFALIVVVDVLLNV